MFDFGILSGPAVAWLLTQGVRELGRWWSNRNSTPTTPVSSPVGMKGIEEWQQAISEFQKEKANEAKSREEKLSKSFKSTFEMIVSNLEKSTAKELKHLGIKIDFVPLKNEIVEKSKVFANIARNHVNDKINLSSYEFKQIGEEKDRTIRDKKMEEYCNNVLCEADKKLINKFDKSVEEVCQEIEKFVTIQTTQITNQFDELQQTYTNLSGSKEEVDKELLRTGEIEAIITLIEATANEKMSA